MVVLNISEEKIRISSEDMEYLEALFKELKREYISKCNEILYTKAPTTRRRICQEEKLLTHVVGDLTEYLPFRYITIEHRGSLKILAFSDFRAQDINMLIKFVRSLKDEVDLIVYAGDDVKRFNLPPTGFLKSISSSHLHHCVGLSIHSSEPEILDLDSLFNSKEKDIEYIDELLYYRGEYILKLPIKFALGLDESALLNRIHRLKEFFDRLHNGIHGSLHEFLSFVRNLARSFGLNVLLEKNNSGSRFILAIVDETSQTSIARISFSAKREEETNKFLVSISSLYLRLFKEINENFDNVKIVKLSKRPRKYVYYLVLVNRLPTNVFEELAKYARYGVLAIIGNDDYPEARMYIRGERVYELHSTIVRVGRFLFMGLEGSTSRPGCTVYPESLVRLRLEFMKRYVKPSDHVIVVSHTPPMGLLDYASRFGSRHIGSLALRDFIDENSNVSVVICGHVHREGGKYVVYGNGTWIVNVSSHGSFYDRGNVALITIGEDGDVGIEFYKIPSVLELFFQKQPLGGMEEFLIRHFNMCPREARFLVDCYRVFGIDFIRCFSELKNIKYKYGFTWDHIINLYKRGVREDSDLSEKVINDLLSDSSVKYKNILGSALLKFIRIKTEEETPFLLMPLPFSINSRIIAFDVEYTNNRAVLFGFYDLSNDKIEQFWFYEKEKLKRFIESKQDYIFVHWGGCDKKFIKEMHPSIMTFNLLYFSQHALIAPIECLTLSNVYDALIGHESDVWWQKYFYEPMGIMKATLCRRILENPNDSKLRHELAEMNKADVIALAKIISKMLKIGVKSMGKANF